MKVTTDKYGKKYEVRHRFAGGQGSWIYEVHGWIDSPHTTSIMVEGCLAKCQNWIRSQVTDKPEPRSLDVRSQAPTVGTRSRVGQPNEAVWTGAGWWTGD